MNDSALSEKARLLFCQECNFVAGANSIEQIPDPELPEIAFAGRSNVGKSSLLNALTNRKSLARVSHTPGRTKQLNFFSLGNKVMLVDMPGYGFAQGSKKELRKWGSLINYYLRNRPNLKRICLLLDSRHGIKPVDEEVMELLDAMAVPYQAVLTKVDKLKESEMIKNLEEVTKLLSRHSAAHPEIILTSSREKEGIRQLQVALTALAGIQ